MPWLGSANEGSGGVPFRRVHDGFHTLPTRETNWEPSHIPYTNRDDLQYGGLSNEHWNIDIAVESALAYSNLRGMISTPTNAITPRSLSLFGPDGVESSTSGWILRAISNERRAANSVQQVILCTIQLEREAA